MSNNLILLLLSAMAGFSTLIGAATLFFEKKRTDKNIVIVLGLSIGILVTLGLGELLADSYNTFLEHTNAFYSVLLIIILGIVGYALTHLLDELLHHKEDNLGHLSLITTLGISMHKLPEGMALFIAGYADIKLGIALSIAIALHHIPEGTIISTPIYYATNNKFKAFAYTFISSITLVLGSAIAMLFINNISTLILGCLFSITLGMYAFIIIHELIPTALDYGKYKTLIYSILLGTSLMLILHLFVH